MAIKDNQVCELAFGDTIGVRLDKDNKIDTKVEQIEGNTIWALDFTGQLKAFDWRGKAFDVTYAKASRYFTFMAEIERQERVKHLSYTRMLRITPAQELQRRASFRLKYSFDVFLRSLSTSPEKEVPFELCHGVDISESGVGLTSQNEWNPGEHVECKFSINGEDFLFSAQVMRKMAHVQAGHSENDFFYRLGLMFVDDDEKKLRKIRRFIYKQQIVSKK